MGAWGVGAFENDDAIDFIAQLQQSRSWRPVVAALDKVAHLGAEDYLEAPDANVAIAAAELAAALGGRLAPNLPPSVTGWLASAERDLADDLRRIAALAVARIQKNSELRDLWTESEDQGAAWHRELQDLITRLKL